MHTVCKEEVAQRVSALCNGDEAAFAYLFHGFEGKLYAFAFNMTRDAEESEEVVQEVFLKVWEKRQSLDPLQNFDGYLFTIARNLVYNKAKERAYHFAFQKYLATYKSNICNDSANKLEYEELKALLEQIYTDLPPVRQKVFIMSRLQGLSNPEIATQLNTSTSNIENHLNKALHFIRERLKGHEVVYVTLLAMFKL